MKPSQEAISSLFSERPVAKQWNLMQSRAFIRLRTEFNPGALGTAGVTFQTKFDKRTQCPIENEEHLGMALAVHEKILMIDP